MLFWASDSFGNKRQCFFSHTILENAEQLNAKLYSHLKIRMERVYYQEVL